LGGGEEKSKVKRQSAKLRNPDDVGMGVLIGGWEFWEFGRFMVMMRPPDLRFMILLCQYQASAIV